MKINDKVPLFLELEFQKLEFLISFVTVTLLSWICAIKKIYAVLKLGKLEYHATQYSSIPGSSTFFFKKKKKFTQYSSLVNSSTVYFFFLFGDNQKINIKIKISSFFMFLFI